MEKKGHKVISVDSARFKLKEYLHTLPPEILQRELKLKYPLQPLLPLSRSLIRSTVIFLLRVRFPLLLSLSHEKDPLFSFDAELKQLYQQELRRSRLKTQFEFEYFIFVCIKLCANFIRIHFSEVIIGREEEEQMYCLIIKAILGLSVERQCYQVIEARFIDQEKYDLIQAVKKQLYGKNRLTTQEISLPSKNSLTMNTIQVKLEKRKLKRCSKIDRSSITLVSANTTMQRFKQELQKSLKITNANDVRQKERYTALEKLNISSKPCQKQLGKKMIHTQQISASLNLSLLLENATPSYTRRDIVLRHSNRPSRLTHRVYQASGSQANTAPSSKDKDHRTSATQVSGGEKQNLVLPPLQERKSHNSRTSVQLQAKKGYWNSLKRQLRQFNSKLDY